MDARGDRGIDTSFAPGKLIAERYELAEHLGKGAMGFVVRALDRTLDNEPIAIKLLYPHLVADATIFARFRNEVLLARRLSHPNIVRIYDFGKAEQGYYFISMEYVGGASLKERLYNPHYEPLQLDETLRVLYEIGQGMAHAHRCGVIHRDLKPDNIMLTDRGEVKITDFGLARHSQVDKGFTQSGETVGTPCYMAPEQIRGERVDPRTDIYSMGIMAYELITGEKPFDDDNWMTLASMHLKRPLPEIPASLGVPDWVVDLIERSTSKSPDDRFQSAEDWCAEIGKYIFNQGQSAVAAPAVFSSYVAAVHRKTRRKRIRKKALARTVALFFLAMLLVVGPPLAIRNFPMLQPVTLRLLQSVDQVTGLEFAAFRSASGLQFNATIEGLDDALVSLDLHRVSLLLAAGVDPAASAPDGTSLFEKSLQTGDAAIVAEFLNAGASAVAALPSGEFPIFVAAAFDQSGAVISQLLEAGAQASALGEKGSSPLMNAVTSGNFAAAQQLIRAGAFVNVKDRSGAAPLHTAVKSDSVPMVQLLLEAGAQVNEIDSSGFTPLMIAARAQSESMVEALLLKGADPRIRTASGKTARDYSRSESRAKIQSVLKRLEQGNTSNVAAQNNLRAPQASSTQRTRLRAASEPKGVWERGRALRLRSVSLDVRNVGEAEARSVKVSVVVPGGMVVVLDGPRNLKPNSTATYRKELSDDQNVVTVQGELTSTVECDNCRTS